MNDVSNVFDSKREPQFRKPNEVRELVIVGDEQRNVVRLGDGNIYGIFEGHSIFCRYLERFRSDIGLLP